MTAAALLIVLNLIIIESLLSVDNAAVLAIMVKDLPANQKKKALRYGLLGAYVFRGLCLLTASILVKIIWLKIAGGIYLLWLTYSHYTAANDSLEEPSDVKDSKIFNFGRRLGLSKLWSTIILVEIMDLSFSIDNIFAAVALSDNIYIIMIGVGIGILSMRFVAGWFVNMMEKYPSLEDSAFKVIMILGLKLILSGFCDYVPQLYQVQAIMKNHWFDIALSGLMLFLFLIPILKRKHASN